MNENTQDISKFGQVERVKAAALLLAIGNLNDETNILEADSELSIEFNPNSGNVFLVDEYLNVAMMNDGKLEDFITCHECGHEDFASEFRGTPNECCQEVRVV